MAADVTIGFVLQFDRAARMVAQHAVDPALPGLEEVIDRLTKATFDAAAAIAVRSGGAARGGARAGGSGDVAGDGRAERPGARDRLVEAGQAGGAVEERDGGGEAEQAQRALLAADIKRFLERPAETAQTMPLRPRRRERRSAAIRGWIG